MLPGLTDTHFLRQRRPRIQRRWDGGRRGARGKETGPVQRLRNGATSAERIEQPDNFAYRDETDALTGAYGICELALFAATPPITKPNVRVLASIG